jgi:hypothetical protein
LFDDAVGVAPVGVLGEVGSAKSSLPQGANNLKAISQEFDGSAASLAKFRSRWVLGVSTVGIEAAIHLRMVEERSDYILAVFRSRYQKCLHLLPYRPHPLLLSL